MEFVIGIILVLTFFGLAYFFSPRAFTIKPTFFATISCLRIAFGIVIVAVITTNLLRIFRSY